MKSQTRIERVRLQADGLESSRRDLFAGGAAFFSAMAVGGSFLASSARAQDAKPAPSDSLYERLGGIFAIAGVVNYFSDEIIKDPVAGAGSPNPQLRQWHTQQLDRLPGLKFMRTLWVAEAAGGPFKFSPTRPGRTHLGLEEAHRKLRISPDEFDAVAGVLSQSLDHFSVPQREKSEVLAAFAAHKNEVTEGFRQAQGNRG